MGGGGARGQSARKALVGAVFIAASEGLGQRDAVPLSQNGNGTRRSLARPAEPDGVAEHARRELDNGLARCDALGDHGAGCGPVGDLALPLMRCEQHPDATAGEQPTGRHQQRDQEVTCDRDVCSEPKLFVARRS